MVRTKKDYQLIVDFVASHNRHPLFCSFHLQRPKVLSYVSKELLWKPSLGATDRVHRELIIGMLAPSNFGTVERIVHFQLHFCIRSRFLLQPSATIQQLFPPHLRQSRLLPLLLPRHLRQLLLLPLLLPQHLRQLLLLPLLSYQQLLRFSLFSIFRSKETMEFQPRPFL